MEAILHRHRRGVALRGNSIDGVYHLHLTADAGRQRGFAVRHFGAAVMGEREMRQNQRGEEAEENGNDRLRQHCLRNDYDHKGICPSSPPHLGRDLAAADEDEGFETMFLKVRVALALSFAGFLYFQLGTRRIPSFLSSTLGYPPFRT